MLKAVLGTLLIVLAGCAVPGAPASPENSVGAEGSATQAPASTDHSHSERVEAPHRNPKMYGPPGE